MAAAAPVAPASSRRDRVVSNPGSIMSGSRKEAAGLDRPRDTIGCGPRAASWHLQLPLIITPVLVLIVMAAGGVAGGRGPSRRVFLSPPAGGGGPRRAGVVFLPPPPPKAGPRHVERRLSR